MTVSNYPKELEVDKEFNLYLYVRNNEGQVTYYRILIKLGNKSLFINETIPMEAPIIKRYEKILMHNQTWIEKIKLKIEEPGMNQRLIFEMWIYDPLLKDFKYNGRWNHIWINVTLPSSIV